MTSLKPVRVSFISVLCVCIGLFLNNWHALAQDGFQVKHFAGSPGGLGTADGFGADARFQYPEAIWGDGIYLYVSDQSGRAIRRINISAKEVQLVAGSLTSTGAVDGTGLDARFSGIRGLWGDGTYLYIAETSNRRIRRMTLATANVITMAGATRSDTIVDGDASEATFRGPLGIWGNGRFLYITDAGLVFPRQPLINGSLRRIDLLTNTVSTLSTELSPISETLAGDGRELFIPSGGQVRAFDLATGSFRVAAALPNSFGGARSISGIWAGTDGFIYVSDWFGHQVVRINVSTGGVQSLFGLVSTPDWVDGVGLQARFREPSGIWGDGTRLYIAERGNHVIRAADLDTLEVTTFAGVGMHVADRAENPSTPSGVSWSDGTYLYFPTPLEVGPLQQIWKMPLNGGPATVFAGAPTQGYTDARGEAAQFTFITAMWGDGAFLYVIDGFGDRIRKVALSTADVTTLISVPDAHPFRTTVSRNIWGDGTSLFVSGHASILQVNLATASMKTVAGLADMEGTDDGIGQKARFRGPAGLWGDGGYLYIADSGNGVIRRMSLTTDEVTTLAGRPGQPGIEDGIGRLALFNYPSNLWGNGVQLYITDQYAVRRLSLATNEVRTIAGSFSPGLNDGAGTQARFSSAGTLWGVGPLLYVGDHDRLRTVDNATGEVVTIGGRPMIFADGTGTGARFNFPTGIWGDSNYLYVTDRLNHVLRRIDRRTAETNTVAGLAGESGTTDGIGDRARFFLPRAICSDGTALYVADSGNHTIRKVRIGTWEVETIAGTPGRVGPPGTLQYINPSGLWCDKRYIYVSDYGTIGKVAIATGETTVLVSGLRDSGPLWSDGLFLYFSDPFRDGLNKLSLVTSEVTAVFPVQLPDSGNIWGDGRYLYMPSGSSILRLDIARGDVSLVAGNESILGTEDGVGAEARFQLPEGIWSDGNTLYIADTDNHAIRTITLGSPQPTTSLSFAVRPAGVLSRITEDVGPLEVGYARVKAVDNSLPPSGMAIYGYRSNGVLVSETGVPAVAPIRAGRLYAETTSTVRTGLAIANPNSQSITISFYFTDAFGQTFGHGTILLDPNRQIAAFLDEQPFSNTGGLRLPSEARTFTFSASQPVATIALRGFVNERGEFLMTTLPIADLSRAVNGAVVIPHFAEGGGWTTQIALVNGSDADLAGTLDFFDESGNRIETQPYAIPARSSIAIPRSATGSLLRVGSIHVTPNAGQQTPVGISIFSFTVSGVTVTETGVPTMTPVSALRIYAETSASLESGFAFANAASQPVAINYGVLSSDGRPLGMTGSLTLPPNGQRALFLSELPGAQVLPAEFKGVLRITAVGGLISAIGLRSRTNERGEFLVSTTMPEQNAAASAAELYVPHFVHGGGYTTEFILMGQDADPNGNAGSLQFYSKQGESMPLIVR